MLIYQTTDQAVVLQEHRWAYIKKGDKKIKWQNRFKDMSDALGKLNYYLIDDMGDLIFDAKGLTVPNREWTGEIHENIEKLITELNIGDHYV